MHLLNYKCALCATSGFQKLDFNCASCTMFVYTLSNERSVVILIYDYLCLFNCVIYPWYQMESVVFVVFLLHPFLLVLSKDM